MAGNELEPSKDVYIPDGGSGLSAEDETFE